MRHSTINALITHATSHSLCKGQLSLLINVSGDTGKATETAKLGARMHFKGIPLHT